MAIDNGDHNETLLGVEQQRTVSSNCSPEQGKAEEIDRECRTLPSCNAPARQLAVVQAVSSHTNS